MAASTGDHAKVPPGTLVNNRYLVMKEVGCGNFSKVYQCKDTKSPAYSATARPEDSPSLALKILKREYANDAAFERDMLKVLASKDPENAAHVCKMVDQFTWNRYPCFVMPLKGPSLRTRKLGIQRGHVTRADVVRLAKCLLQSLRFVHFDCKMVHTDLKPENILLTTNVSHLGDAWTLCDFGSASLWRADRMDSDLISTRPYRAPEVVLGNPWSYPADMWSIGCIVYEAACGSRLFEVHDDNTHLHIMESRLGQLPEVYTKRSKHSKKFFDAKGNFLRPAQASSVGIGRSALSAAASSSAAAASSARSLPEVLKEEPLLLDLLQSMLHFDPSKRIRADVALEHPIFDSHQHQLSHQPSSASSCGNSEVPSATSTPRPDVQTAAPAPAATSGVTTKECLLASLAGEAPKLAGTAGYPKKPVQCSTGEPSAGVVTKAASAGTQRLQQAGDVRYKALPPLMNAFNALHLDAKENFTTPMSACAAAAQRPVQGPCRTPEELKRAPLSAHVGTKPSITNTRLTTKYSFSGMPSCASSAATGAAASAASQRVALQAAGKASGLRYFGR